MFSMINRVPSILQVINSHITFLPFCFSTPKSFSRRIQLIHIAPVFCEDFAVGITFSSLTMYANNR